MTKEKYNEFSGYHTIPDALGVYENSDRYAIVYGEETLTYRELLADAQKLALSLCALGIGRGDRIPVDLNSSISIVIAELGILYAGASFVIVDRNWPKERLDYVIRDCNARLILNDDRFRELTEQVRNGNLPEVDEKDEFAVLYTSGSTGQPKGCVLHHQTFYNSLIPLRINIFAYEVMERCERVYYSGTLTFVGSCALVFLILLCGKTMFLATNEENTDPELKSGSIIQKDIDTIFATPSVMSFMLSNETYKRGLRRVRLILLGGEKLTGKLTEQLEMITDARIVNAYGSTEILPVTSEIVVPHKEIRFRNAVYGAKLQVLTPEGRKVLPGMEGEVCVGGVPAELGYYLGDDELTQKKYTVSEGLGRIFHTGDRGIYNEDGSISILGRMDNMKKLHGQRIELDEIERCMEKYPGIEKAVADIRGEEKNAILLGWYSTNKPVDEEKLLEFISKHLPTYMIPQRIQKVIEFPRNRNNKLDRKALPDIEVGAVAFCAPVNKAEKEICEVFSEILNIDGVGRNTNFFRAGGDSFHAMSMIPLLQKKTGKRYSVPEIFKNPTPAKLAVLHNESDEPDKPANEPERSGDLFILPESMKELAKHENVEAVYPADISTSWMIILEKIAPKDLGGLYSELRVDLKRTFTEAEINERVKEIVTRHPVLRSYGMVDNRGEFWQVFLKQSETTVWYRDLKHLEKDAQDRYMSGFFKVMEEKALPFQIGCFPLSDERCSLLIRVNHSLADGFSLIILINELTGESLPAEDDKYFEYRNRQIGMGGYYPEDFREYYSGLGDDAYTRMTRPVWGTDDYEAIRGELCLSEDRTGNLIAYCSKNETTLSEYVEYCYGKALLKVFQKHEVWYFHSFSGRDPGFAYVNGIIGNLARNVPVCIREGMTKEDFEKGYMLPWKYPYALEMKEYRQLKPYQLKYGIVSRIFPGNNDVVEYINDHPQRPGHSNHFVIENGRLKIALFANRGEMEQKDMDYLVNEISRLLIQGL